MSADNMLVAIPAKDGKIALYDVTLSDMGIDLDGPEHEVCAHIARRYAKRRVGVYDNREIMQAAADAYHETVQVEYGVVDLTARKLAASRPGPG